MQHTPRSPHPTHSADPYPWLLRAESLTKTFGQTLALSDASVTVRPGEAVAIMGASGSGKSTLLHALAGVLPPDRGTVLLRRPDGDGFDDLAALTDAERSGLRLRRFGFVFQQGLLIPELTAGENVALPLLLAGISRHEANARAATELHRLGLAGLDPRRIGQLSGGQAQRVAIARALAVRPSVIFADEPTGALDSGTASEVLDALVAASTGPERALVVVTHDEQVAARCGRVVRLRDGRVEEAQ
ncbi:ABC transporter ATP-binding protein [Leucobacter albus]|uniref:ABC transporter ATP-binding protein n=1 Tax=Leucobacter albus TaxID=272210 RepID=A0ABW3TLP5_9MICO